MAFKIAISGIKSATTDLDVTGNNIANANTTGFKESRAEFADIYATSNLGTSKDAVGQGVQLAQVAQQFKQGNISFTDNSLDMAINGEGFFVMDDNGARTYTRAGAFGLDTNGYIVNATGQNLMAFQADANGNITGAIDRLRIDTSNIAPQATTSVEAQLNLDAGEAVNGAAAFSPTDASSYTHSTSLTVYDSLGQEHVAVVYYRKTGANTWQTHLRIDGDNAQTTTAQALAFNNSGALTTAMPISYGTFTPTNGAAAFTLSLDFAGTTQYGADYGTTALSQDGFTTGRLSGIDIDDRGVVLARFTNGQSQAQGQIMMANFSNPQGLQPMGDTIWAETSSSGQPLNGAPGTGTLGLVQAGALEESNVELAEQLVNMIVAQRAFQANAQVISTEDEITQTIINIR